MVLLEAPVRWKIKQRGSWIWLAYARIALSGLLVSGFLKTSIRFPGFHDIISTLARLDINQDQLFHCRWSQSTLCTEHIQQLILSAFLSFLDLIEPKFRSRFTGACPNL